MFSRQVWRLCLVFCASLLLTKPLYALAPARAPSTTDLKAAIDAAAMGNYFESLSSWLSEKAQTVSQEPAETTIKELFKDQSLAAALWQRTFLYKYGVGNIEAFIKADSSNKEFLLWLMQDTEALDQFLLGAAPIGLRQREDNSFGIPGNALTIWKQIYDADPAAKKGLLLKLAMATALNPPGTGCRGAGQPEKQEEPLDRYLHFKEAHAKKELVPSFDDLAVWELRHVTCSMASHADMSWGREMVNTWNPEFKKNEGIVDTTSQVWRRNSPISHANSYKNVMAGGGKCGPRSSWSVFICQAWGVPATGVGQPAHACVAYRKPDGVWSTAYGRSWAASKLLGLSGDEFVAGMFAELQPKRFALVEHMRWLALVLPAADQGPLLELAKTISKAPADSSDTREKTAVSVAALSAQPTTAVPPTFSPHNGLFHIDAGSYFDNGGCAVFGGHPGVGVSESYPQGSGKQIHFAANMGSVWAGYKIKVPKTGVYELVAKIATVNFDQGILVRSYGAMYPVKSSTASAVYKNMVKDLGSQQAVDSNPSTRWAVNEGVDQASLEIDLGEPKPISTCMIDERFFNRVSKFKVEYKAGDEWKLLFEDTNMGIAYEKDFPSVTAQYVRLTTLDCRERGGPTIWDFSVGETKNGAAWINLPCTYGLWENTKPADIHLVEGEQTIWFFAPFQRGITLKSFDLKAKQSAGTITAKTPLPVQDLPSTQLKDATGEDPE